MPRIPALMLTVLLVGCQSDATRKLALRGEVPQDFSCLGSGAIDVALPALYADKDRYVDKCVRVSGVVEGPHLVNAPSDITKLTPEQFVVKQHEFIGLMLWSPQLVPFPQERSRAEFIGRLRRCYAKERDIFTDACHFMDYAIFSRRWRALR